MKLYGIEEEKTPTVGMAEKAKEFVDKGSEIYQGNAQRGGAKSLKSKQ